ncbi:uncharacterized protein [Euwallacea fornicatus]|uniref:uncharacterized protein isoform X2 n=1 Tax=Euwallacea fornicatus TaxID=995702 RepID=UPI00338DE2EC
MESSTANASCQHQKRMGPAPFASFEDLSDEMESPGDKEIAVIRLPGISEQEVPSCGTSLEGESRTRHHSGVSLIGNIRNSHSPSPSSLPHSPLPIKMKLANTPRIDISRASSSSHHDSRDSTPEREMFDCGDPNTVKLGLGFKEDDALELRLSTEELDFHDVTETKSHKYKHRSASPEFDELYINSNRKDSQCSDVILLSISGRTSRISSIGSQGSAQSRLSNASHISIMSGQSAYSRCSSPHKTLLETSFCGNKGSQLNIDQVSAESKEDSEDLEKVLLSRRTNPAEAILADNLGKEKGVSEKPKKSNVEAKPQFNEGKAKLPRRIISKSGVEYIYIPLKGPMPVDDSSEGKIKAEQKSSHQAAKTRRKPAAGNKDVKASKPSVRSSVSKPQSQHHQEPTYIRIKLKPDHCYEDDGGSTSTSAAIKPATLNLPTQQENGTTPTSSDNNFNSIQRHHARSLTNSPKLQRKEMGGSSPSQSVIRRNSFVTLFRTGPDSPNTSRQKRKNTIIFKDPAKNGSANVSSTESVDSKGKYKSLLTLFKFPRDKAKPNEPIAARRVKSADAKTRTYRQEKREQPLSSESIRIPLHSPTYYENKSVLEDSHVSSQESQVTVVEVIAKPKPLEEAVVKKIEVVEKIEMLDTRLQVDSAEEQVSVENNRTITTTAELNQIPADLSCHSLKESKIAASDSLGDAPKLSESASHLFDEHNSSESERDVELEYRKCEKPLFSGTECLEIETKAIVLQQDSFEDELPYVPTTLPQERSSAVPILPIKQRTGLEMKTCPIDRPRSTTPIHSSGLDNYLDGFGPKYEPAISEKLKISLPKGDTTAKMTSSEIKKPNEEAPPPLPPKGIQKSWINFEEVPERRKPPKRIQTIPSRGHIDIGGLVKENVVYTYVNPDECKCECHEQKEPECSKNLVPQIQEDEVPLLGQDEKVLSNR